MAAQVSASPVWIARRSGPNSKWPTRRRCARASGLSRRFSEEVLFPQRSHMSGGLAHRHYETRIGKQAQQVFHPRHVVVALGYVTVAFAQEEHLAEVIRKEAFERRITGVARQDVANRRVMCAREETHPNGLFHGFGTFGCDLDAVPMAALNRVDLAPGGEVQKPVPPQWRMDQREVPVAVRGHAPQPRHEFQQNRRPRTRQTGDEHRFDDCGTA